MSLSQWARRSEILMWFRRADGEEDQRSGGDRADPPWAQGARRRPLKVVLSNEFPRSATSRVAECSALIVRRSAVSAVPRLILIGQVRRVFRLRSP